MKLRKNVIGFFALVLAIGASAFTTVSKHNAAKKVNSYYWFVVDAAGNTVPSATAPSFQTVDSNPFGCPNGAEIDCARGYSSYQYDQITQKYTPVGSVLETASKEVE